MSDKLTEVEPEGIEDEVVELIDEEGNASSYFHLGTMDYEGEWYVFFQPAEANDEEEEDEVVIFRLGESEEGNELFPIEDEELLEKVFDEFCRRMDEEEEDEEE